MAEARTPVDETEEEAPETDPFAVQTRNIFKTFMYERLTSQIEEEAIEGNMSVGDMPRPVIEQLIKESSSDGGSSQDMMIGKVCIFSDCLFPN